MKKPHGIFCMEGDWEEDLRDASSVEPVLELLKRSSYMKPPFIRRDVGTEKEFMHYLGKWTEKKYQNYPILYLAFHGEAGLLDLLSMQTITLDELEIALKGKCKGRVIYFGTCKTMDVSSKRLNKFLQTTGAVAVCGYTDYVDWMTSASLDLFILAHMQDYSISVRGMKKVESVLKAKAKRLSKHLGFFMKIRGS